MNEVQIGKYNLMPRNAMSWRWERVKQGLDGSTEWEVNKLKSKERKTLH